MMKKIFGYLVDMRVEMLLWELFSGRGGRGLPLGVFLLFLGLGAAGQQLSGVVRDSQTREGLAGVSLSSVRTGRMFLSGGDGRFSFAGSLGDTLLVRFLGYKTRRVAVEGAAGGSGLWGEGGGHGVSGVRPAGLRVAGGPSVSKILWKFFGF